MSIPVRLLESPRDRNPGIGQIRAMGPGAYAASDDVGHAARAGVESFAITTPASAQPTILSKQWDAKNA